MRALKKSIFPDMFVIWALMAVMTTQLSAQELSERSVKTFMEYAWSLTPQQFSKQDGTVIVIDKNKKDDVFVPLDVAREVIRVGRITAHAQICGLPELQVANHRSLMRREEDKKVWTDQQLVYINQLHLTTMMLLTGRIRLVEKEGDKEVVVDEGKSPSQTCTDEQRSKVKDLIIAYIESGPNFKINPNPVLPGMAESMTPKGGADAPKSGSEAKTSAGATSSLPSPATAAIPPAAQEKPQVKQ